MHAGNFVLILHTHLPWVLHHGDWPHGTDWLCEAVAECYVPLLNVFNDLLSEGITPNVTLDISPVLCEQLEHPDFAPIFEHYCDQKIKFAAADFNFFMASKSERHFAPIAKYWEEWYSARKKDFISKYNRSVVGALKSLQDIGAIEVMTCGATHGYFPLLGDDRSVRLQMKTAVENYQKHFGRKPRGTWIPECAYRPEYDWRTFVLCDYFQTPQHRAGVEQILSENEIRYFVVDEHSTTGATPLGFIQKNENGERYFRPMQSQAFTNGLSFYKSPLNLYNVSSNYDVQKGIAVAFSRHKNIAMSVWSGETGYPGDPDYLDFHKKHFRSALRYWRVTDNKADMQYKQPYNPAWTAWKTEIHAHNFIKNVEATLLHSLSQSGKKGTLCTPFDTELFGHWWFEGPEFLRHVLRGLHFSPYVHARKASDQIGEVQPSAVMAIPESSWGEDGNHKVWIGSNTEWTWREIYKAEQDFSSILNKYPLATHDEILRKILLQALRELMLMQASDWQFLIYTVSAKDYSERRFLFHYSDFIRLCEIADEYVETGELSSDNTKFLTETEQRNSIFPELRLEWWTGESNLIEPLQKTTSSKTVEQAQKKTTSRKSNQKVPSKSKANKKS